MNLHEQIVEYLIPIHFRSLPEWQLRAADHPSSTILDFGPELRLMLKYYPQIGNFVLTYCGTGYFYSQEEALFILKTNSIVYLIHPNKQCRDIAQIVKAHT